MGGLILLGLSSNIFAGQGCDHQNFKEYIYDKKKMKRLLKETGKGCQLEGANLKGMNLEGAYLFRANLKEANLEGANLKGANLKGVNLEGAKLKGANLEGADLKGANLKGADLKVAKLKGADLKRVNFEGADLKRADLRGVKLKWAKLKGADLKRAVYDDTTTFPFWFVRAGKGLLKDVPCSVGVGEAPNHFSGREQFIGVEKMPVDSYGERKCGQEESTVPITNGQRKGTKKVGEKSESLDAPTGVLQ